MENDALKYTRYTDDTGEEYYCPSDSVLSGGAVTQEAMDACVEASTAGRYSGNLEVIDRFSPSD